ncbi:LPD7 domain-containing protein [Ruegeria sp. EL01]|uniref:LPD7 domain-containing protein n=1 Tax=Ruegeria sp. EL01 TaxID=2107578 RepID=UPI000EA805AA|nr:LPD7 domain-containing protein [Ruegeria sp. EL01]
MADPDPTTSTNPHIYTLSEAHSERVESFATMEEAARAFADADATLHPRVIESSENGARTLARTVTIGEEVHKSAPRLETLQGDRDEAFWVAYHARETEKQEGDPEKEINASGKKTQSETAPNADPTPDSVAEPDTPQPGKSPDERFALPASFQERFILTKEQDRQELFRSYDDTRPAISDRGDSLRTKNADRGTAMDMIELAAHRSWSSMKVTGPEEFRREMWIEGTAQGIRVQGYRPNDKDRAEADRRAELIGERSIERTDRERHATGEPNTGVRPGAQRHGAENSNVVPMIDYQQGLKGKITGIGDAPYRDREGATPTPFVSLELADGRPHKLWGVGLPDMIDKHDLSVGDHATIYDNGRKAVTVKERDPKTGEEREKQTFRREWGAREIERAPEQVKPGVEPVQKRDVAVIETTSNPTKAAAETASPPVGDNGSTAPPKQEQDPDPLAERLIQKEAAQDPALRGAASVLAHLDAELRAAGISEKDRTTFRDHASRELADGLRAGRQYDVQRLPNVTTEQQKRAKSLTARDVAQIIESAKVRTPPQIQDTTRNFSRSRENSPQSSGRER